MLAVMQHEEHTPVSEGGDQATNRVFAMNLKAEHGPDRARRKSSVSDRCQVDQPDAVFIFADHSLRDGEGDSRFADASWSDHGHEALPRQSRDKCFHGLLSTNYP